VAHARKLQGWITIRGPNGGTATQDADDWLDLEDYDDIVVWSQMTEASNIMSLEIETAPVGETEAFTTMVSLPVAVTTTPVVDRLDAGSTTNPLAKHLRWKCVGRIGGAFSLTFRVWIVASGRLQPLPVSMHEVSSAELGMEELHDEATADGDDSNEEESPAELNPTSDADDVESAEDIDEGNRRAWRRWRPPVIVAGPRTMHVEGMTPAAAGRTGAPLSRRLRTG